MHDTSAAASYLTDMAKHIATCLRVRDQFPIARTCTSTVTGKAKMQNDQQACCDAAVNTCPKGGQQKSAAVVAKTMRQPRP